jgi:hydroxymethylglutaryl-CoA synthase
LCSHLNESEFPVNHLVAYSAYIPHFRLRRSEIHATLGEGPTEGSRSVASFDEDATSMSVEAARRALKSMGTDANLARLYFGTTTPAYLDKTNANVIHAALALDAHVLSLDVVGSVRSGVGSVVLAAESPDPAIAVMADVRVGLPGGADEREGGDAAAAFVFDAERPGIATVLSHATMTKEFLDRWRLPENATSRQWEERFGAEVYSQLAEAALDRALADAGVTREQVDVLVASGLHGRAVKAFAGAAGVRRVADDLTAEIGNSGAAHPWIILADVLDRAEPNQTVAVVTLADGATAMVLRTTELIASQRPAAPVRRQLAQGRDDLRYATYLAWRGMLQKEPPRRPDPLAPAAPPSLRSADYKYGFVGSRCAECGTLHLPAARVCMQCKAIDHMKAEPMADAAGTIATFTVDHLAYSPSPPTVFAVVDFDAGGRFSCELTDVSPDEVAVGSRVEMTFRRITTAQGIHNYFWKVRPASALDELQGAE